MKTTIQVGTPEASEIFSITAVDVNKSIASNDGCGGVINKSNLNYEIDIRTNGLASFIPFSGIGNAWGTKFGFTFGMGDYDPGAEVFFQNGMFAMAKFFEDIEWRPYENMGGQELAAEAAESFAKKIAKDLRLIGLDVGRPVFPLVWTLNRVTGRSEEFGVEDVTVTIVPRIAGALYTSTIYKPEYYLSPRDVMNAVVFYASSLGRPGLTINEKFYGLDVFLGFTGVDTKDYDIPAYQASSYGHFVERWPNFEVLDQEASRVLRTNQHIMERIEELLESGLGLSQAAVEIIQLFDRTHGNAPVGLTETAPGANTAGIYDAEKDEPLVK